MTLDVLGTNDPFAEFRADDAPSDAAFKRLSELVKQLTQAEEDVANAQQVLKSAQERLRQLDEFDIPEYMDEVDLKEFVNKAGIKIEARSTVYASIGNRKAQAFAWLIKYKHSAMIKRTVSVAFNTAQGRDADKLLKEMIERDLGAGAKQEMKVEAASLTAFVRRELKAGHEVPADIFGIYHKRSTKITLPSE